MAFALLTVLALLATLLGLTFLRFKAGVEARKLESASETIRGYAGWFGDGVRDLFGPDLRKKAFALYTACVLPRYPAWRQWALAALAGSFAVCAGTGFVFALFVPRGMFGLFLLAHVMSGGLFAVSLAVVLLLRSGAYRPGAEGSLEGGWIACPVLGNVRRRSVLIVLFWAFAAAGLVLIATALLSMLPYLHFGAQIPLLETHRYGALAALIAAVLVFDLDVLPRRD